MPVYERKETYSLGRVFSQLPEGTVAAMKKNPFADFDGDPIRMRSQRYQLFRKSVRCVRCGLEGTYFAKERFATNRESERYHFNLYGTNANGKEVMLTKDHIIPKSKGGKDVLSNYQTMCAPCNQKKGDNFEAKEIEIA